MGFAVNVPLEIGEDKNFQVKTFRGKESNDNTIVLPIQYSGRLKSENSCIFNFDRKILLTTLAKPS